MKASLMVKEVLHILQKNRAEHVALVEKARAKCREMQREWLLAQVADLEATGNVMKVRYCPHDGPATYQGEYDDAIMLLEMTKDDTVELDAKDFASYVRNKWKWRDQFNAANDKYGSSYQD